MKQKLRIPAERRKLLYPVPTLSRMAEMVCKLTVVRGLFMTVNEDGIIHNLG